MALVRRADLADVLVLDPAPDSALDLVVLADPVDLALAVPCTRPAPTRADRLLADPVDVPASVRVLALAVLVDALALVRVPVVLAVWLLRARLVQPSPACVRRLARARPTRSVTKRAKKAQ
ncbi:hypothetical protein GCM10022270_13020 [Terriglobus aquaticus]